MSGLEWPLEVAFQGFTEPLPQSTSNGKWEAESLYPHRPLVFELMKANWDQQKISVVKPVTKH